MMNLMVRSATGRYRQACKAEVLEVAAQYLAASLQRRVSRPLTSPVGCELTVKPQMAIDTSRGNDSPTGSCSTGLFDDRWNSMTPVLWQRGRDGRAIDCNSA